MTARLDLPDVLDQALSGERAARRVLRRIRDNVGGSDELLGELQDVVLDDGRHLHRSARLRAFCRTIQKALEAAR